MTDTPPTTTLAERRADDATQVVAHGPAYLSAGRSGEILRATRRAHRRRSSRRRWPPRRRRAAGWARCWSASRRSPRRTWRKALGRAARPALPPAHLRRTRSTPELVKKVPINFAKQARSAAASRGRRRRAGGGRPAGHRGAGSRAHAAAAATCSPRRSRWPRTIVDAINSVYDRVGQRGRAAGRRDGGAGPRHRWPTSWKSRRTCSTRDDEAPIIRLVNSLLFRAAKERASDIHIEPMERELIGALPHRRRAPGDHQAAQALPELDHQPREDHGAAQHRREAPAAGRPHPHQAGRPRHRHPRLDHPDRRTASASSCVCSTRARRCSTWPRSA